MYSPLPSGCNHKHVRGCFLNLIVRTPIKRRQVRTLDFNKKKKKKKHYRKNTSARKRFCRSTEVFAGMHTLCEYVPAAQKNSHTCIPCMLAKKNHKLRNRYANLNIICHFIKLLHFKSLITQF
jgi:hypothetical protein